MRRGSRWGAVAALLVALLAVGALNSIQPRGDSTLWYTAVAPDTADAKDFRVTVADPAEGVIVAQAVSRGYQQHITQQRLVLVQVRYEFLRADTVINDVRLVSPEGYSYQSLTDFDVVHHRLQPGFSSDGIVVFEVPEAQIDGATLEFCRTAIVEDRFKCARIEGALTPQTVRHDGAVTIDPANLTYEVIGA